MIQEKKKLFRCVFVIERHSFKNFGKKFEYHPSLILLIFALIVDIILKVFPVKFQFSTTSSLGDKAI